MASFSNNFGIDKLGVPQGALLIAALTLATAMSACSKSKTDNTTGGGIKILSGDAQVADPGEAFAQPVVAVVYDSTGSLIPKATLVFEATGDGLPAAYFKYGAVDSEQTGSVSLNASDTGEVSLPAVAAKVAGITTRYRVYVPGTGSETSFTLSTTGDGALNGDNEIDQYIVISEHDNVERAGVPFGATVKALNKAGAAVTSYNGAKNVEFAFAPSPSDAESWPEPFAAAAFGVFPPVISVPATINFVGGVAVVPATTGFEIRRILPDMVITVVESSGVRGRSDPLRVSPGDLSRTVIVASETRQDIVVKGKAVRGERMKTSGGVELIEPSVTDAEKAAYPPVLLPVNANIPMAVNGFDRFDNAYPEPMPSEWAGHDVGFTVGNFPTDPQFPTFVALRSQVSAWNVVSGTAEGLGYVRAVTHAEAADGKPLSVTTQTGVIRITSDKPTRLVLDAIQLYRANKTTLVGDHGQVTAGEQLYFTLRLTDPLGRSVSWKEEDLAVTFASSGVVPNRDPHQSPVSIPADGPISFCNGWAVQPSYDIDTRCPATGDKPTDGILFLPVQFFSTHGSDPRVRASFIVASKPVDGTSHAINLIPGPHDHYTLRPGEGQPSAYYLDPDLTFITYDGVAVQGEVWIYASDLYGNDTKNIPATETDVRLGVTLNVGFPMDGICEAGKTLSQCSLETYFSCSADGFSGGAVVNCLDVSLDMRAREGVARLRNLTIDSPSQLYYVHAKSAVSGGKATFDAAEANLSIRQRQIEDRAFHPKVNCDFRCVNRFELAYDNAQFVGKPFDIDIKMVDARRRVVKDAYLNSLASTRTLVWDATMLTTMVDGGAPDFRPAEGFESSYAFADGVARARVTINRPYYPVPFPASAFKFDMQGTPSWTETDFTVRTGPAYEYRIIAVDGSGNPMPEVLDGGGALVSGPFLQTVNADSISTINVKVESIDQAGNYVDSPSGINLVPEKVSGPYAKVGAFGGNKSCVLPPGSGSCIISGLWYKVGNVTRISVDQQVMTHSPKRLVVNYQVVGGTVSDFAMHVPAVIKAFGGTSIHGSSGTDATIVALDGAGNELSNTTNADSFLNTGNIAIKTRNIDANFPNQNACTDGTYTSWSSGTLACTMNVTRAGTIAANKVTLEITAPAPFTGGPVRYGTDAAGAPQAVQVIPNQPESIRICSAPTINNYDTPDVVPNCSSSLGAQSVRVGVDSLYYMISFDAYDNSRNLDGGTWDVAAAQPLAMGSSGGPNGGDPYLLSPLANGQLTFRARASYSATTGVTLRAGRAAESGLAHVTPVTMQVTFLPAALSKITLSNQTPSSAVSPIQAGENNFQIGRVTAWYTVDGTDWEKWDFGGATPGTDYTLLTAGSTELSTIPSDVCLRFAAGNATEAVNCGNGVPTGAPPKFSLTKPESAKKIRLTLSTYDSLAGAVVTVAADTDPIYVTAATPDHLALIEPSSLTVRAGDPFVIIVEPQDIYNNPTTVNCAGNGLTFSTAPVYTPTSPGGFGGGTVESPILNNVVNLGGDGRFTSSGNKLFAKSVSPIVNKLHFEACGKTNTVTVTVTQAALNAIFLQANGQAPDQTGTQALDARCGSTVAGPNSNNNATTCPQVNSYLYDIYGNPFDNDLGFPCDSWAWSVTGAQSTPGTPTLTPSGVGPAREGNRTVSNGNIIDGRLTCSRTDTLSGVTKSQHIDLYGGIAAIEIEHNVTATPIEAGDDNVVISKIRLKLQKNGVQQLDTGRNDDEIVTFASNTTHLQPLVLGNPNPDYNNLGLAGPTPWGAPYAACTFVAGECTTPIGMDFYRAAESGVQVTATVRTKSAQISGIGVTGTDPDHLDATSVNGTITAGAANAGTVVAYDIYGNKTAKNCADMVIDVDASSPQRLSPNGGTPHFPETPLTQAVTGEYRLVTANGQDAQYLYLAAAGTNIVRFDACGLSTTKTIEVSRGRAKYIAIRKTDVAPATVGLSDTDTYCSPSPGEYNSEGNACETVYAFFWDQFHNPGLNSDNRCPNWTYQRHANTPNAGGVTTQDLQGFSDRHALNLRVTGNFVDGKIGCAFDDGAAEIIAWGGISRVEADFKRLETDDGLWYDTTNHAAQGTPPGKQPALTGTKAIFNAKAQNFQVTQIKLFTRKEGAEIAYDRIDGAMTADFWYGQTSGSAMMPGCHAPATCGPTDWSTGRIACTYTDGVCTTPVPFSLTTLVDDANFDIGFYAGKPYYDRLLLEVDPGPGHHLGATNYPVRGTANGYQTAGQDLNVRVQLYDEFNNLTNKGCLYERLSVAGATTSAGDPGDGRAAGAVATAPVLPSFSLESGGIGMNAGHARFKGEWRFDGAKAIKLYDARPQASGQQLTFTSCSAGPSSVPPLTVDIQVKWADAKIIYLRDQNLSSGEPTEHIPDKDCTLSNPASCTLFAFAWDQYGNWIPDETIADWTSPPPPTPNGNWYYTGYRNYHCPSWSWTADVSAPQTASADPNSTNIHLFSVTDFNNYVQGTIRCTAGSTVQTTTVRGPLRKSASLTCSPWACDGGDAAARCVLQNLSGSDVSGATNIVTAIPTINTGAGATIEDVTPTVSAGSPLASGASQFITVNAPALTSGVSIKMSDIRSPVHPNIGFDPGTASIALAAPSCSAGSDIVTAEISSAYACNGSIGEITLQLRNDSPSASATVGNKTWTPAVPGFVVSADGCAGQTLAPGATCLVTLQQPSAGKRAILTWDVGSGVGKPQILLPSSPSCP